MTLDELLDYPPYIAFQLDSWLMSMQQLTGIGFDQEGARELVARIDIEMAEIAVVAEANLPPRNLNVGELKKWTLPAKPWKKDGSLSATMIGWAERAGASVEGNTITIDGFEYPLVGGGLTKTTGPMSLKHQEDLKEFLLGMGWVPTIWNLKRDAKKKPVRDERGQPIRTSPKFQEDGRLCPNLELLDGEFVRPIVRWLSLKHRRSLLESTVNDEKGLLNSERLAFDARLGAGSSGVTPTYRQKHTGVANIPKAKAHVVLGKEMRALFRAQRPGYVLVGYDAKALENRIEAHYCMRYEGGQEHAEKILHGDPHINNALAFFPEELAEAGFFEPVPEIEDHPVGGRLRGLAKNGRYCLGFGGGAPKLAATLGISAARGVEAYDRFWESNLPLKYLKQALEHHWGENGKKYIKGIDGRRIRIRSKHSLVNYCIQSAGSIAMAYSGLFMHRWLGGLTHEDEYRNLCYSYKGFPVYRVGYFHDEFIWEVPEHLAEEISQMGRKSIVKAGEHLKLKVPLDGTPKVGMNWKEIH